MAKPTTLQLSSFIRIIIKGFGGNRLFCLLQFQTKHLSLNLSTSDLGNYLKYNVGGALASGTSVNFIREKVSYIIKFG